jgi:aminoglycoside phosphotransferase (APT) family kinase protein
LPDLLGRTALLLVAALPAGARVLFLVDRRRALLNQGNIADANFLPAPTASAHQLPLRDGTVDCVVLDAEQLEAVPDGTASAAHCQAVLAEIKRVLRTDGELVLLTEHRRMPPDWRQFRRYCLVPPDRRWGAALTAAAFHVTSMSFAKQDGARLTGLTRAGADATDYPKPAGYKVLRCRPNPEGRPSALLETILERVAAELESGRLEVVRCAIRKIGKTSITVARKDGRRYLIRVPRSTVAAARARRNHIALETLAREERLPVEVRRLVPRPILYTKINDFECYVEECIAGSELKPSLGDDLWHPQASSFLVTLHTHKRFEVLVDEGVYRHHFGEPLETIRRHCEAGWAEGVLDGVEQSIRRAVAGRTLPLTWTHGDFFHGNCLSDARGQLTGVVDWELFSTTGLPLLDLLQSMIIPGENNAHRSWQRFDRILSFLTTPSELLRWPLVASYLRAMAIPDECVPALLRMYWVDHVANRIAARRTDSVWLRKRVYQPLEALKAVEGLADASLAEGGR